MYFVLVYNTKTPKNSFKCVAVKMRKSSMEVNTCAMHCNLFVYTHAMASNAWPVSATAEKEPCPTRDVFNMAAFI